MLGSHAIHENSGAICPQMRNRVRKQESALSCMLLIPQEVLARESEGLPTQVFLVRLSGEAAIEIHGKVLVEDDSDVSGADLHFLDRPRGEGRHLSSDNLL